MTTDDDAKRRCGTCTRGWNRDNGNIACGCGVDDDALVTGVGNNPIWAVRKAAVVKVMVLGGIVPSKEHTEAENMDPNDGANCVMWRGPAL